ncbi:hypothetical protein C8R46DRAFT_1042807 [Mycena filopes]|nr:hypothetical protein C8R46DRAFT_1042807 [Mycena filopes]
MRMRSLATHPIHYQSRKDIKDRLEIGRAADDQRSMAVRRSTGATYPILSKWPEQYLKATRTLQSGCRGIDPDVGCGVDGQRSVRICGAISNNTRIWTKGTPGRSHLSVLSFAEVVLRGVLVEVRTCLVQQLDRQQRKLLSRGGDEVGAKALAVRPLAALDRLLDSGRQLNAVFFAAVIEECRKRVEPASGPSVRAALEGRWYEVYGASNLIEKLASAFAGGGDKSPSGVGDPLVRSGFRGSGCGWLDAGGCLSRLSLGDGGTELVRRNSRRDADSLAGGYWIDHVQVERASEQLDGPEVEVESEMAVEVPVSRVSAA